MRLRLQARSNGRRGRRRDRLLRCRLGCSGSRCEASLGLRRSGGRRGSHWRSRRRRRPHGHGALARLKRLDALGKRLKRQVAVGAHHARAADLERQARVRGRFQLGHHITKHLQHARQAVRAEQGQLIGKLTTLGSAYVKGHIGVRQAHHVQVAHVLRKFARELRQVRTRFHEFRNPAKARGGIARADGPHDIGHIVGVHAAKHALCHGKRDLAFAERNHLFKRRQRIAHAATGVVRDQVKCIAFEFHAFGHAYRA